jgi:hypothetical protein
MRPVSFIARFRQAANEAQPGEDGSMIVRVHSDSLSPRRIEVPTEEGHHGPASDTSSGEFKTSSTTTIIVVM